MDLDNSETEQKYFFGGAWVACVWCLPGGVGAGGAPPPLFLSILVKNFLPSSAPEKIHSSSQCTYFRGKICFVLFSICGLIYLRLTKAQI